MIFEMAEPEDLQELFDYLSPMHRDEVGNWAIVHNMGWQDFVNGIATWTDKHGAYVTKDQFGRVLCMWSTAPHPAFPQTDALWFLTTRAFFDHTAVNLRAVRRYFERNRAPGWRFTTMSFTNHPKARKWAKLLGFNSVLEQDGGLRFTFA